MLRAEPMTIYTVGTGTSYVTRFAVLLVSQTQLYMWQKLDTVSMAK